MQAARYTIPNPKMELRGLYGRDYTTSEFGAVCARAGGLSAARARGGCGRGQVAYRRLGHVGGRGRGQVAYRRLGHARRRGRGQVAYRRLGHVGGRGRGQVAYRRLGHARGRGRGQVAYRRLRSRGPVIGDVTRIIW